MWVRDTHPDAFVALVTKDVNLRMKAKAADMEVQDYLTDKVEERKIEEAQKEVQTRTLPSAVMQELCYGPETSVDGREVDEARPRPNQLYKMCWQGDKGQD